MSVEEDKSFEANLELDGQQPDQDESTHDQIAEELDQDESTHEQIAEELAQDESTHGQIAEELAQDESTHGQIEQDQHMHAPAVHKTAGCFKVFLRVMLVLFVLACSAIGVVVGLGLYYANGIQPTEASSENVHFVISKGSGSAEIARQLKESGMIRNETVFRVYLRIKNQGNRFQAGEYAMKPGTTIDEIIARLNKGDTVKVEMIRFTIPEGHTIVQIADRLAEQGLIDRDVFLELMNHPQQFDAYAVVHIPEDPLLNYSLEGYLFPDTYEMVKGSSEQEMINRMILELDKKMNAVAGYQRRLDELGITFHQMMTIASLIEREVAEPEERSLVAGVIYNRLSQDWKLEIDATVQYASGEHKERLLYSDLREVDSPYNTYQHPGMPPGPIASPGIEAIKAALYPQETKYMFYVTKKDGTRGHLFAETFQQHQQNIKISNQNAQKIAN